jgi:riboflavin synthase
MFTGIIECMGTVLSSKPNLNNLELQLSAPFGRELKIDQSLAHNGVCLTVTHVVKDTYTVTAIAETLEKTNLGSLKKGDKVNLERSMQLNGRLDGHIVQGHVDQAGICTSIEDAHGSWLFTFEYDGALHQHITVEKGSICVNGVSLTVARSMHNAFTVAIIPYTFEHTSFGLLKVNSIVNLEFDVIGKYVAKTAHLYSKNGVSTP